MDINKIIDSWVESVKPHEQNIESRASALIFLFAKMKSINITLTSLKEEHYKYIISKFNRLFISSNLAVIHDKLLKLDIKNIAESILDREEVQQHPTSQPIKIEVEKEYDADVDVLDEEGYLDGTN